MDSISNGPKYLNRTVNVILELKREKIYATISVKNIRRIKGIDGSNRSAVNLYANALTYIVGEGVLRTINNGSPKKYAVIDEIKLKSFARG